MSYQAETLPRFLIAVAVVLLACHLMGTVAERLGQPAVVGEVAGGLVLGPSVLGLLWSGSQALLFPPDVLSAMNLAAQLGLTVFMFLLGCELTLTGKTQSPKAVAGVVAGGTVLPFLAGVTVAAVAGSRLTAGGDRVAAMLFVGVALSITALPVLARILVDLAMQSTRVGTVSLTSAAIGDTVAWTALAMTLSIAGVGATASALSGLLTTLLGAGLTLLLVRPLLAAALRHVARLRGGSRLATAILVGGAILYAAAAEMTGLHPVIGAFLFGAITPRDCTPVARLNEQLRGFALVILLPMFFAGVGLKVSVGLLAASPANWLLFVLILVAAVLPKLAGASGGAWLGGVNGREAWQIGVLMNCRGVTELVVAMMGHQYGLINDLGLTMLVMMALITTVLAGPLARRLSPPEPRAAPAPAPTGRLAATRARSAP